MPLLYRLLLLKDKHHISDEAWRDIILIIPEVRPVWASLNEIKAIDKHVTAIIRDDFLQVQVLQVDEKLRGIYCNPLVCSILNFLFFYARNELPQKDYIEFRHLIDLRRFFSVVHTVFCGQFLDISTSTQHPSHLSSFLWFFGPEEEGLVHFKQLIGEHLNITSVRISISPEKTLHAPAPNIPRRCIRSHTVPSTLQKPVITYLDADLACSRKESGSKVCIFCGAVTACNSSDCTLDDHCDCSKSIHVVESSSHLKVTRSVNQKNKGQLDKVRLGVCIMHFGSRTKEKSLLMVLRAAYNGGATIDVLNSVLYKLQGRLGLRIGLKKKASGNDYLDIVSGNETDRQKVVKKIDELIAALEEYLKASVDFNSVSFFSCTTMTFNRMTVLKESQFKHRRVELYYTLLVSSSQKFQECVSNFLNEVHTTFFEFRETVMAPLYKTEMTKYASKRLILITYLLKYDFPTKEELPKLYNEIEEEMGKEMDNGELADFLTDINLLPILPLLPPKCRTVKSLLKLDESFLRDKLGLQDEEIQILFDALFEYFDELELRPKKKKEKRWRRIVRNTKTKTKQLSEVEKEQFKWLEKIGVMDLDKQEKYDFLVLLAADYLQIYRFLGGSLLTGHYPHLIFHMIASLKKFGPLVRRSNSVLELKHSNDKFRNKVSTNGQVDLKQGLDENGNPSSHPAAIRCSAMRLFVKEYSTKILQFIFDMQFLNWKHLQEDEGYAILMNQTIHLGWNKEKFEFMKNISNIFKGMFGELPRVKIEEGKYKTFVSQQQKADLTKLITFGHDEDNCPLDIPEEPKPGEKTTDKHFVDPVIYEKLVSLSEDKEKLLEALMDTSDPLWKDHWEANNKGSITKSAKESKDVAKKRKKEVNVVKDERLTINHAKRFLRKTLYCRHHQNQTK